MLEMASLGSKVLQTRSVELAMNHHVRVQVLSSFDEALGSDLPGTLVVDEEEIMAQGLEKSVVSGIAFAKDEAKITVVQVPDRPGVAAAIFGPLAEANINVDMIVQNVSVDGSATDMTFTVPKADLARAVERLERAKGELKFAEVKSDLNVSKVSVIGVGMRSHAGVALKMFETLAAKGITSRSSPPRRSRSACWWPPSTPNLRCGPFTPPMDWTRPEIPSLKCSRTLRISR